MEISNFDLKKVQDKLLDIAKCFHAICEKYDIPYYMLGGTMLGAVRHKGFIPWDDDMDFGVMLDDFPRLTEALINDLPPYLKVRNIDNSCSISNTTLKIEDCRYEIVEIEKENVKDCIGLNIDVFPLSCTNLNEGIFSRNWFIKQLVRINWCRYLDYKNRGMIKNFFSKFIKFFISIFPKKIIPNFIEKIVVPHKGDFITNYWDNEIVRKDVMGEPVSYEFENEHFWGVAKPDAYLKRLYGDYMKLPSQDEIHLHIVTCKKRKDV